jgi:hypothetical protein
MAEKVPLTQIGEQIPRPPGINFAKVKLWAGDTFSGHCEDPTHPVITMGRVTYVKGNQKIRDGGYWCAVCKPKAPQKPKPRQYPPTERFPEPEMRLMGEVELWRILDGNHKEPPWWPGPEPKAPPDGSPPAEVAAYLEAHKRWVKWSRMCWQARCQLVSFQERHRTTPTTSAAWGYEA